MYFDDFFDEVLGFGFPKSIVFNTGKTKDMMPCVWKELTDDDGSQLGYKATCRTVGISAEDVKVEIKDDSIIVTGETEFDGDKYTQHFELPIVSDVMANIKDIKYKSLNGLTYIYLYLDKPTKKKINIQKI